MEELRVLVVSDDPLARRGLALLLSGQEGIDRRRGRSASTTTGPIPERRPDWTPPSGTRARVRFGLERLRESGPSAPPAVAVVADEVGRPRGPGRRRPAVLPRDADGESLAAALRAVVQGLVVLDDSFAAALLRDPGRSRCSAGSRREPHPAGGRGAPAPHPGAPQQGDRPAARHQRSHGQVPRQRHPRQARRPEPRRGDRPGGPAGWSRSEQKTKDTKEQKSLSFLSLLSLPSFRPLTP